MAALRTHDRRTLHRRAFALATAVTLIAGLAQAAPAAAEEIAGPARTAAVAADEPELEPFRPQYHFSPQEKWINDPNGLVHVDGTYHLFFQHNPFGVTGGNGTWGHATSPDLVTWERQNNAIWAGFDGWTPVAGEMPPPGATLIEHVMSGSVVIDEHNSSGFGLDGGPAPLVAIYTSGYANEHPTYPGIQAQSLAYSNDNGDTWTKYENNPVLNRNSANFRDPKVLWYEPESGPGYWVMVAVEATQYKTVFYKSSNLKDWTYLSEFGPANASGGIWECPDLFPMAVDGDPENTRWVLVVNLSPGAPNGGSGGQYFVGDFDGTTFTSESTVLPTAPAGTVLADFEGGDFGAWTVANEPGNWKDGPFGLAPAGGALTDPPQGRVSGFLGDGLVNGYHDGNWPIGSMESPAFTVTRPYVNLLVGGGNHPHVEGGQLTNNPPAGTVLFDFELPDGTFLADTGWTLTGDFATDPWRNPTIFGGDFHLGAKRLNTWEGGPKGDSNVGLMTSPSFEITGGYLSFLLGGGRRVDGSLQAELVVGGQTVRAQTGPEAGQLNWVSWDVAEFAGQQAQVRIRDEATGGWGHLTFDHLVIGDEPALVRSDETTVNLIVDGEVVRSATGADDEMLDWASWDVREFTGQQASIRVVDNNRFEWGHVLLDHVMFADAPATPRSEEFGWLDWGRDYYATVSYFGAPGGKRIMQGWMNNWNYAETIPTSPWRGSMALPREVELVTVDGVPRLRQRVVQQLDEYLDAAAAWTVQDEPIAPGHTDLGSGDVVRIDAVLDPADTGRSGITVFAGTDGDPGTMIGYDAGTGRVFIDRTGSGHVDFHQKFPSIDSAPVDLDPDGTLTLEVYLDRASVEVFTGDGLVTLTDQVFPLEGADRIGMFADGPGAGSVSLTVTPVAAEPFGPVDPEPRFTDVPPGSPFFAEIEWAAGAGITTGWPDGTFRPANPISRDAVAAMLYRAENGGGAPVACTDKPFADVAVTHPFCGHIAWMKDQGITTGWADNTYRPALPVSREAVAAFLHRAWYDSVIPACTVKPFHDVPLSNPFCGAIAGLADDGVINGWSGGLFKPDLHIERQAFAAFLHRHAHP